MYVCMYTYFGVSWDYPIQIFLDMVGCNINLTVTYMYIHVCMYVNVY